MWGKSHAVFLKGAKLAPRKGVMIGVMSAAPTATRTRRALASKPSIPIRYMVCGTSSSSTGTHIHTA